MIPFEGNKTDTSQDSKLEWIVKDHITMQGCIRIQKSSGIFIARK